MRHAIEVLEAELKKENLPNEEDEDNNPFALHDAVIHFRRATDLKMAIKMLNQWVKDAEEISKCKY